VVYPAVTVCGLVGVYQCSGKTEGQFIAILLHFSYQPEPSFHHSPPTVDNHIPYLINSQSQAIRRAQRTSIARLILNSIRLTQYTRHAATAPTHRNDVNH